MADAPILGGTKKHKLDDEVFGVPFNGPLVHEVVVAELAARRRGTHATKTRGMVRGGGAKPWRQKGTGRARQGSRSAPHWTGGGVVFGGGAAFASCAFAASSSFLAFARSSACLFT